jgi:hypothetical protein
LLMNPLTADIQAPKFDAHLIAALEESLDGEDMPHTACRAAVL